MTERSAAELFERDAGGYDEARRQLVPPFDAFYGTAVEGLGLAPAPPRTILDLGAGTGILARHVLAAYPDARLTLVDASAAMLAEARAALGGRAAYVERDLGAELPVGPWDAIVSALAIHHLEHSVQRNLFARVHAALAPSGVFVNAEQLAGPTPSLDAAYAAWHERAARVLGASAETWAATEERMRADRCATLEDHLRWLRAAGFPDADCLFKLHRFGVVVARRGPAQSP